MPNHDIVVVGASAGGVEVLRTLAASLPAGLPASVFVVLHMSPEGPGLLATLLARTASVPVEEARDGASFERGHMYLARPDHHLLLENGRTRVVRGAKENRARPAVDPLFRSAALEYGPRVIGVVLTGALNDGAAGLAAIKEAGGLAVVQDPEEALFPSMPRSALHVVAADHVVRVADLGALLGRLVTEPAAHDARADERARVEVAMGARQHDDINTLGHQSPYSCPECGGVLNDIADQAVMRFRCRVGHAYTADTLVVEQEERIEDMLWAALRALEESAGLKQRMADRLREGTATTLFRRLKAGAEEAYKNAAGIRRLIGSLEKQVEQ